MSALFLLIGMHNSPLIPVMNVFASTIVSLVVIDFLTNVKQKTSAILNVVRFYSNIITPTTPFTESRVAIVINHPQQVKLLGQGALWIKAGISRPASAVMAGLSCLGAASFDQLAVAVYPLQTKIDRGFCLQLAPLSNEFGAIQVD